MSFITTKGVYGLSAIYELSLYDNSSAVQIKTLANKTNISANYLEQLFSILKKNGFVVSIRGAKGGYLLAKKAEDIKILDILRALEGELCFAETNLDNDILKLFFENVQEKIEKVLDVPLTEFKKYEKSLIESFNYTI